MGYRDYAFYLSFDMLPKSLRKELIERFIAKNDEDGEEISLNDADDIIRAHFPIYF